MAEMDQGIKRLIQTHPADMLALALPDAHYLGTLPVDVATEPQLVLDTLLRIRYEGIECALDLEAEAYPRADIGERLFEYASRAKSVHRLSVISAVLWLQPGGPHPTSPYVERIGSWQCGTWNFIGVEVYNTPVEMLMERGILGLLPLVPFSRGGGDLAAIERAAETLKERAAPSEVSELEALLAVFGARVVGNAAMLALTRRLFMSTEILETSPLYQEWVRKATAEGLAQGLAQGLREATLSVLRGRFGAVPTELDAAVRIASTETLQPLLKHAASETLEQIAARLGVQLP